MLLADIFATCYGRELIKEIRDTSLHGGPRIDPKFVNNPELSDVQFRVEGRVFYAHKLILITASARFKSMLNSKFCEGNPPVIQINDIRYDIFQVPYATYLLITQHIIRPNLINIFELRTLQINQINWLIY